MDRLSYRISPSLNLSFFFLGGGLLRAYLYLSVLIFFTSFITSSATLECVKNKTKLMQRRA